LPVCSPSPLNSVAPTGQIFMKINILVFFWKSVKKGQVLLQSDKNNRQLTWRPIYLFDHILLNSF
jgi:hypothetical protein